jgi:hypothetical protein
MKEEEDDAVQSGDTRSFTARTTRLLNSEYVTAQWPLAASEDGSLVMTALYTAAEAQEQQQQQQSKAVHTERQDGCR